MQPLQQKWHHAMQLGACHAVQQEWFCILDPMAWACVKMYPRPIWRNRHSGHELSSRLSCMESLMFPRVPEHASETRRRRYLQKMPGTKGVARPPAPCEGLSSPAHLCSISRCSQNPILCTEPSPDLDVLCFQSGTCTIRGQTA